MVGQVGDQFALLLDLIEQGEKRTTIFMIVFIATVGKDTTEVWIVHGMPHSTKFKVLQNGLDS